MLGHKTSPKKFKRNESIQSIFSNNKLKINYKETQKTPSTWKRNDILLNNSWVKKKKSQGNLKIFELNENKNTTHGNA